MTVTASVVNWNTKDCLRRCLESLRRTREGGFTDIEVLVVDNASADGSAEMVRREFREVRLIANDENLGYGRAHNQAAALASGELLLILNADVEVDPEALRALTRFLESEPRAALAAPNMRSPGRAELPPASFSAPGLGSLLVSAAGLNAVLARVRATAAWRGLHARLRPGLYARPREAVWVGGACMLARLGAFKAAGGFDESLFLFREDTDLCLRLRDRGGGVFLVPGASVLHLGGRSMVQAGREIQVRILLSHWRYHELHPGPWPLWLLSAVYRAGLFSRWLAFGLLGLLSPPARERHRAYAQALGVLGPRRDI